MSKIRIGVVFLFLLACVMPTYAESASNPILSDLQQAKLSGNDLLRGCNVIVKGVEGGELADEEHTQFLFWIGYIAGSSDAYAVARGTAQGSEKRTLYCPPATGIENGQIARIVAKFLKEHPALLHQSARVCLSIALTDALPCRK